MRPRNYNNGKIFEVVNSKTNECLYYGYSTANLTDIKHILKLVSTILNIEIFKKKPALMIYKYYALKM